MEKINSDSKTMPVVSVIMPAYNAEKYIHAAVESVISQSFCQWELIVINDGSTDNTAEIVKEYMVCDPRVVLLQQTNKKQAAARNAGIKIAKGNWVAFLDADDIWIREKLEIQLRQIQEENVDLVFSSAHIFTDIASLNDSNALKILPDLHFGIEAIKKMLAYNFIPNLTVLVSLRKVRDVGLFCEDKNIQNAEDYHLWLKLLAGGCSFFGSEKILAAYRMHDEASTAADRAVSLPVRHALMDIASNFPNLAQTIIGYFDDKYVNEKIEKERLEQVVRVFKNAKTFKLLSVVHQLKKKFGFKRPTQN